MPEETAIEVMPSAEEGKLFPDFFRSFSGFIVLNTNGQLWEQKIYSTKEAAMEEVMLQFIPITGRKYAYEKVLKEFCFYKIKVVPYGNS